eukprot:scaffold98838_cov69-Phaeocystis_antarctica.AAC.8
MPSRTLAVVRRGRLVAACSAAPARVLRPWCAPAAAGPYRSVRGRCTRARRPPRRGGHLLGHGVAVEGERLVSHKLYQIAHVTAAVTRGAQRLVRRAGMWVGRSLQLRLVALGPRHRAHIVGPTLSGRQCTLHCGLRRQRRKRRPHKHDDLLLW